MGLLSCIGVHHGSDMPKRSLRLMQKRCFVVEKASLERSSAMCLLVVRTDIATCHYDRSQPDQGIMIALFCDNRCCMSEGHAQT